MKEYLTMFDVVSVVDKQRKSKGFLGISELISLAKSGNVIFDPFSTLISVEVKIGTGNVFYPSTTIELLNKGEIFIGNNNCFYGQTYLLADFGEINIGNRNTFGDGGVSIKANRGGVNITVENDVRLLNYIQVIGNTSFGSGTQVIGGPITVQDCIIKAGFKFDYQDPNERGGVLKGFGLAKNLTVNKGEVINGLGLFDQRMIEKQISYHSKK